MRCRFTLGWNAAHHCNGRHSDGLPVDFCQAKSPLRLSHRKPVSLSDIDRSSGSVSCFSLRILKHSSPEAWAMSMHNQETTLAVHQQNSFLRTGQNVRNRKEKEGIVQTRKITPTPLTSLTRDPARAAYRVKHQWVHIPIGKMRGKLMCLRSSSTRSTALRKVIGQVFLS